MDDSYIHSVTWLKCCGYVSRPSKTIKVKVSVPSKTIKMGYWGPSKTIKMTPEGCGHPELGGRVIVFEKGVADFRIDNEV